MQSWGAIVSEMTLLLVDDEPFNLEILEEYLEEDGYRLDTAGDGVEAWEKLEADPGGYDIVILDRMMPRMDGLEVLRRMKAHAELETVPVILQTAMAAQDEINEGLAAGAFYYLTKPFDEEMLRSVVATAAEDRRRYRQMQQSIDAASRLFGMMRQAHFHFRTVDESRDLATMLANACPDPNRAVVGLLELLLNAVEHGNLGITYDEKSRLRETGSWEEEVARRQRQSPWAERVVEVEFQRDDEAISIRITDQGDGFDWRRYLDFDPERAFDSHGRGIAMSRIMSFDELAYQGKGNEVVVKVYLEQQRSEAA